MYLALKIEVICA